MTFLTKNPQTNAQPQRKKSRSVLAAAVIAIAVGLGAVTSIAFLPQAAHAQSATKISPDMINKIESYQIGRASCRERV